MDDGIEKEVVSIRCMACGYRGEVMIDAADEEEMDAAGESMEDDFDCPQCGAPCVDEEDAEEEERDKRRESGIGGVSDFEG